MTMLETLRGAPTLTVGLAVFSTFLALVFWLYGLRKWWWWRRAIVDLVTLQDQNLNMSGFAKYTHREIHAKFEAFKSYLDVLLKNARYGSQLVQPILNEVSQYQRSAVIGGESGWSDLIARHLDRLYRPLRWMRAAAGWVVLFGLAGTVLGFFEALPRFSDAFSAGMKAGVVASQPPSSQASAVIPVLGSLGGVFLATLAGVGSALWLYCWAMFFEGSYEKLASEVEILGRRWFVPLIQSPDTVLDEAVSQKLEKIFVGLSKQLTAALGPPIQSFTEALGRISKVSDDFSDNIVRGRETVQQFSDVVSTLQGSTQTMDSQLSGLLEKVRQFLDHLQKLRQQGDERLVEAAGLLAIPARSLASSAEGVRKTLEATVQAAEKIGDASVRIAASHQAEVAQLVRFEERLYRIEGSLAASASSTSQLSDVLDRGIEVQEGLLPELRRFADAAPELAVLRQEVPGITRLLAAQDSHLVELASQVLGLRKLVSSAVDSRLEPWVEKLFARLAAREEEVAQGRAVALDLLRADLAGLRQEVRTTSTVAAPSDPLLQDLLREIALALRQEVQAVGAGVARSEGSLQGLLQKIADRLGEAGETGRDTFAALDAGIMALLAEIRELSATRAPSESREANQP